MGPRTTEDKITAAVDSAFLRRPNDLVKWIGIFATVISLTVGTVAWAYTQTGTLKDWTAEQNYATKKEISDMIDKYYVPKADFTRMEQKLNTNSETLKEIKAKLDRLLEPNNRNHDAR